MDRLRRSRRIPGEHGYDVVAAGGGPAGKDAASGTALGVRVITQPTHIVLPISYVYIEPSRYALQHFLEENQTPGPGYGFSPTWNEDERALLPNISTVEQEFAWNAVTGRINIDASWDDYVRRMMGAGLDRLLKTVEAQK